MISFSDRFQSGGILSRMTDYTSGNALGFLLTDSARMFRQLCDRMVADIGSDLTSSDIRTLSHVIRYRASTQAELAVRMAIEPMTLSTSLKRLELRGLVSRPPGSDRRTKVIQPTEEGLRIYRNLYPVFDEILAQLLSGFSPSEAESFTAFLQRTRSNLSIDGRDPS